MSRDAWVVGNWSDNDDARERPETAGSLRCDPRCVVRPTDAVRRLMPQAQARPGLTGAVALFLLLAVVYSTSIDIRATRGASITADEPFYLVTTQSLLQDRDLDLRNQYMARSYEAFFDHPDGLWTQSVPLADGRVLSPHNVGLSVLLLPGFAIDGLVGAQVQLVLIAALTWAARVRCSRWSAGARGRAARADRGADVGAATVVLLPEIDLVLSVASRGQPVLRAAGVLLLAAVYARRWLCRALRRVRPRPSGPARRWGRLGARVRRVPPRDVRVAHAVQREPRLRGRHDRGRARPPRRVWRSGLPAVGAADRPAVRRRALGAGAVAGAAGAPPARARRRSHATRRGLPISPTGLRVIRAR